MLCALIMAGGKGERFWPLSTDEKPKQFLRLLGNESMIQMTVRRISSLIPMERIFVVTGKRYVNLLKSQLPRLPERNIIVEPVGKNTAPCIALSAFVINKYYKDSSMVVLPSDHLIADESSFINAVNAAYNFVEDRKSAVVTIGMKPSRPETGYGYIKCSDSVKILDGFEVKKVEKFVEKPDEKTANRYVEDGHYLWNGGMFIWRTDTILGLMKKYQNNTYSVLKEVAVTSRESYEEELEKKYKLVDDISVDYGIMEKAVDIYVIPADFGWDDVGSWQSVERYMEKDDKNNVCVGDIVNIKSANNIVISSGKPVVVVGLKNIFVVESGDVILVGTKESIKDIKNIKKMVTGRDKKNSL